MIPALYGKIARKKMFMSTAVELIAVLQLIFNALCNADMIGLFSSVRAGDVQQLDKTTYTICVSINIMTAVVTCVGNSSRLRLWRISC